MNNNDMAYMQAAIRQAKKAFALNETPIGCVIVYEGRVIAKGYNRRITDKSTIAHAEISAIKKACAKLGDWRLEGCTIYVTLEPCPMCAGAILQARIDRLVYGASSPKAGCAGSITDIFAIKDFNHNVEVSRGVMEEECSAMMSSFFKKLREADKKEE